MVDYSNYDSICSIIDLVGQAVFIPLLGYMQLPDANIIPFITFTIFLRHMIKGFAVESWMMYLGSSIDLMASYSFSAIRSLATKCVEGDEVGKMLALIYSVESIIPMFMTQVQKIIYSVGILSEMVKVWLKLQDSYIDTYISLYSLIVE